MKEAIPQLLFLGVLLINLITSMLDSNRSAVGSLTGSAVLLALTYWGGFFLPLVEFLRT